MKYRRFTQDFKRSLIEQLLSEAATPLELCRRYNISSGQLYTWKRQYAQGKLNPEPFRAAELAARVRELERLLGKLTLENEFLKKALQNSLKQAEKREGSLPKIAPLLIAFKGGVNLMDLPRRTYYYAPKHKASEKTLIDRIGDLCLEFPRYGYRRVTKQLHREGWIVNHKKVARIMRENNWSCRPRKKSWVATTDSNHGLSIYPNLIKDLTPSNVNQLWVADITSIRIFTCFVYLAVILDAFSRKAIGYSSSKRLDTKLALGALQMALCDRHPQQGCIHHSDRGVQYASREYVKELTLYNFQISMSRKGNPYDNV